MTPTREPCVTLVDVNPEDCERMFKVWPPVPLLGNETTEYVVAGWGLETVLGTDLTLQIFPCDPEGRVIDWNSVFDLDDFCRGLPLEEPAENWPEGWLDTVFNSFNT